MNIIKFPNKILRTPCTSVMDFTEELHKQLDEMKPLMLASGGVGLSANQVGITKRFFIMQDLTTKEVIEFINPEIINKSPEFIMINEGCLSLPNITLNIPGRHKEVTVKFQDRNGEERTAILENVEAVCVQHELEHLDGLAYFDKASRNIRRILKKQGIV